jgi:hypothetical protein
MNISQLSSAGSISESDLLALWKSANSDTRKVSIATLLEFLQSNGNSQFLQSGVGAQLRTFQDKDRDIFSVRDFMTSTVDGTTNNQVGITTAVAAAFAAGADLEWPAGTYVSSATIPNFHAVRHTGAGAIKRGTSVFYVKPREGQTNTLYVSPTGNNANDGLSPDKAFATWQAAFDATKNYGPVLAGTWQIVGVAGTFDFSAGAQTFSTPSKNRVIIKGPAVGGHPNVPTCLIDGGGNGNAYSHGFNLDGIGVRVQVQDLKFQNFKEASGNTRIGIVAANGADFYSNNVHTADCSWTGIDVKECEQNRVTGGILDCGTNGAYGIISDSSHSSVGYNAGSLAGGPIVRNAKSAGVYWGTGSQGHCDFVTFEDCAVGFLCAEGSRADTVGNNYKRSTVAKRYQGFAQGASGGAAENFNDGTADANGTNIEYKGFSGDTAEMSSQGSGAWMRIAFDRILRSLAGTTPTTLATPYTIPASRLKGIGKACRVYAMGVFTQATAGSVLTVNIGGMALSLGVPAAATNAPFEIDVTLFEVGGGYRAIGKLSQGLNAQRIATATSGFVSTSDQAISIAATLAASGDSMAIYRTDVYLIG